MADGRSTFQVADYCIFAFTLAVSLGIGIYYALSGGRQRTTSEFFVGGGAMNWLPVTISLLVTFESSILMLGFPAEAYMFGIQAIIGSAGFVVANIMVVFLTAPLFHPLKVTSVYEYLEKRFKSKAVHLLGSSLGVFNTLLYMGIVLYGPALALDAVTGFPQLWSIFIVGLGSTIYTSIGGLKAVIWTDVFQACVMFSGVLAVLIKGTIASGGPAAVWNIAQEGGRLNFFNFDPDPTVRHTFWNLFFGSIVRGIFFGFNQSSVQRIMSQKTLRDAQKVLLMVTPAFFITVWLALYEGIVAYAYYSTIRCDPLANGNVNNSNQVCMSIHDFSVCSSLEKARRVSIGVLILALTVRCVALLLLQIIVHMVMEVFKRLPGMPGIFLAALFSASLSTLSSGLSSSSACIWQDLIKPYIRPVSELKATIIAKISIVVCGALACALSVLISLIGGPLSQITGSILSSFGGPLSGLFLLAALCPWANKWGALGGTLTTLVVSCYLSFGSNFIKLRRVSYQLSPAPTDGCLALDLLNVTTLYDVTAMQGAYNVTEGLAMTEVGILGLTNSTLASVTQAAAATGEAPEAVGLQKLLLMSYQWFGSFTIFFVFIIGSIISFLTGTNKKDPVDPKYLVPLFERLFPCLPASILNFLRCGVDYSSVKYDADRETVYDTEMKIEASNGQPTEKGDPDTQQPLLPPNYVATTRSDVDWPLGEVKVKVEAQVKGIVPEDGRRGSSEDPC